VRFYSGMHLDSSECIPILARSLTRLVILGGLAESGKTTALVTIYNLFQKRPFGGFDFKGSRTLLGFERRSHFSRATSNGSNEDTERTVVSEQAYLHLDLKKVAATSVILTDISGETFNTLRNSSEACKKFTIAKRADHFALFVDCESLLDPLKRHRAKSASLGVLRSLIDTKMLSDLCNIQIIFSKWDLLYKRIDGDTGLVQFLELLQLEFRKLLENFNLTFHHVASRPATEELPYGFGLDTLIQVWTKHSQFIESNGPTSFCEISLAVLPEREFLKYSFHGNKL
jgi:hypothetical protein